jgi:hypothetical protein
MKPDYDQIGVWSEVKLDIVREYAVAQSTILAKQRLSRFYVDAFAGPGVHLSRNTGEWVAGSPLNALAVQPPFKEFHFIDTDGGRAAQLKELGGNRPEVFTYEGDCNDILPSRIFPRAEYSKFGRALCLLDPYNIDLSWDDVLVEAYRKRLREVAGFQYVPEPMPMRNSTGNTIYYLFFASPNATGKKIVEAIFNKYRNRGAI